MCFNISRINQNRNLVKICCNDFFNVTCVFDLDCTAMNYLLPQLILDFVIHIFTKKFQVCFFLLHLLVVFIKSDKYDLHERCNS